MTLASAIQVSVAALELECADLREKNRVLTEQLGGVTLAGHELREEIRTLRARLEAAEKHRCSRSGSRPDGSCEWHGEFNCNTCH